MVERNIQDRSDWVTIDGAWLKREFAEGVRQFFAPFVGAGVGFWRGLTYGWRR